MSVKPSLAAMTGAIRLRYGNDNTDVTGESRYLELVRQLQSAICSAESKHGATGLSKKAPALLEELVVLDKYARPQLVLQLRDVMKYEKSSLHELIPVLMWRALTGKETHIEEHVFTTTMQLATKCCFQFELPEARRSVLLCILMHILLQQTTELKLNLPHSFIVSLIDSLRTSLDHKMSEKRGFATKTTWHEGKKARLVAHLSALALHSKIFMTHVFPYSASIGTASHHSLSGISEILARTAVEYSHKVKDIPIVRQTFTCLTQIAEVSPEAVTSAVVPHLPTEMQHIEQGPISKKEKEKMGGNGGVPFPCWDPLAASSVAKLCLAVLHKQSESRALKSPFMKTLNLLFHHSRYAVFADIVLGVVKRNGMFYVFTQPDEVYGSKELIGDYTVDRTQSMLRADHVTCSTGLRLTSALCEQHLLNSLTPSVLLLRQPVLDLLERFSYDPFIVAQGLKASIWLTAVELASETDSTNQQQCSVSKPIAVRNLLHTLIGYTNKVPIHVEQTLDYLKTLVKAMRLLKPVGGRDLLIPAFTGIVGYLTQRCTRKVSVHGFYSILQEFLLQVDVTQNQSAQKGAMVAPLDIDVVPYQRNNGGTCTLSLILDLLDSKVSSEVLAAEMVMDIDQDGEDASQSVDVRIKSSKLLIEAIRFAGDFGNVMVNSKGSDCASNMLQLLVRLQALLTSQPYHIVWEAGLALLKLSARSISQVRVRVFSILNGAIRLRHEMSSLLQPLLSVVDMTLQLHESFESAQKSDDILEGSDTTTAEEFFRQHEDLKQHLAVYVKFADIHNIRLLGSVAEKLLAAGQAAARKSPAVGAAAVKQAVRQVSQSPPDALPVDSIDLLFA